MYTLFDFYLNLFSQVQIEQTLKLLWELNLKTSDVHTVKRLCSSILRSSDVQIVILLLKSNQ